ncbi:MAG: DUF2452 domain-containing protein [Leptospiraceae bacterium]|nr:DUF2452 domain-containing protein [Leptospiraceae bacterium]MCP5499700.1 DUF2452 domain-containing protein [Leptospiraceae bacterium]
MKENENTNRHNKKEPVVENKHSLPYPTRTLDPPIRLVDRAREIESADMVIQTSVNSRLELIAKQIRNLQDEAKQILEQAELDLELHRVKCNFEKKVGQAIHLYVKDNGDKYFSLLSKEEWGKPPHIYLGTYMLNADRSFKKIGGT